MAKVSVLNVAVLENPSPFHSPFRFEISFECSEALADGEAGPVRGGGGTRPCPRLRRSRAPRAGRVSRERCASRPSVGALGGHGSGQRALSRGGLVTPGVRRLPLSVVVVGVSAPVGFPEPRGRALCPSSQEAFQPAS